MLELNNLKFYPLRFEQQRRLSKIQPDNPPLYYPASIYLVIYRLFQPASIKQRFHPSSSTFIQMTGSILPFDLITLKSMYTVPSTLK